jgi:hypothetical protein
MCQCYRIRDSLRGAHFDPTNMPDCCRLKPAKRPLAAFILFSAPSRDYFQPIRGIQD